MSIMDSLVKDSVILKLGVRTKREALVEMANALAKCEPQIEADRLLEVLLEREALQSPGIGAGVAIPHGKLLGLDRVRAAWRNGAPCGVSATTGEPVGSASDATASNSGSGRMTMPGPPPNGESSVVLRRSCVKPRRSCTWTAARPASWARPTMPAPRGAGNISGKMVTMWTCMAP